MLVSPEQAIVASEKAYAQTMAPLAKEGKVDSDPAVSERVRDITGRIIYQAIQLYPHTKDWDWSITVIDDHKMVNECGVVPIPDNIRGEVPVAFVVLKKGEGSEVIGKAIKHHVDKKIGPTARPHKIYFVHDLPKTRSGKIMRRILKALLANEKPKGLMTLVNPASVTQIKQIINSQ